MVFYGLAHQQFIFNKDYYKVSYGRMRIVNCCSYPNDIILSMVSQIEQYADYFLKGKKYLGSWMMS